jgi:regulatory protein YycH of two-component signal transduction system YycFG
MATAVVLSLFQVGHLDELVISVLVVGLVLFAFYRLWLVWAYKLNFREVSQIGTRVTKVLIDPKTLW